MWPRQIYTSGSWEVDLGQRELRAHGAPVPVGHKAFDIIELLVGAAGNLLTKDDLMARLWPGHVVEENRLQVHMSAVRKALGQDRGLLRTACGRGYRLLGEWRVREEPLAQSPPDRGAETRSARPRLGNLPAARSDLIGRAEPARRLEDLMSAYRVVTLTGPGGIGKTRLALEVARNLSAGFDGDVWLVELASISDPALLASVVAGTLGLDPGGEASTPASVARAIGGRRLLLVLDTCEHLIEAAAELVETILRWCPGTSILATSRELLRIDGEHVYPVPPLEVPSRHQDEAGDAFELSAVQLFVTRMKSWRFDFSPQGADLATIGAICRRLDGVPLAIELAASRAATLGTEQVLSRLDERFALLTNGRRTAPPRHQTLRATLDWSYELLSAAERRALCVLALFAGEFTLDGAIAVAGDPASMVAENIANLVAKSLLQLDRSGDHSRWRLLETTRAYALEKLAESGDGDQAARRHAEFFLDFASRAPGSRSAPENPADRSRETDTGPSRSEL